MKQIIFNHDNALISNEELHQTLQKAQEEIERMNQATQKNYDDDRASINLATDIDMRNNVKKIINQKKDLNPEYIVVVGIGGSNLGTIAVQEAVLGKLFNQHNPQTKILYADTVDSDLLQSIISIIEPVLKQGKTVIINGVSKSGGTTETIANFETLLEVIKQYHQDYHKYLVVTTDKNSKFWNWAQDNNVSALEIPKLVGGRYSVFSPVGLFPLGLIGIDIDTMLDGAAQMRTRALEKDPTKNPALISAALLYLHNQNGKTINDMFLFNTDLESIGKWYRQLMGESIGKEHDNQSNKVNVGITPTVSIGSTDLHSMAQLYLGGPYDKYTTFISVQSLASNITVPNFDDFNKLVDKIQAKPLSHIMDAILKGVQTAFQKDNRPYNEIILPDKSPHTIGQLLQFKMMEMMYLGFLLNVNPFDQPNVEAYKIETKKILQSN